MRVGMAGVMDEAQVSSDCKFCTEKGTGRYTCPRCNARYCSVDCYKAAAHLSCSELFYRDCFMEGLQTMQTDSSERTKLMEMLQRLEMDSELVDDDGAADLAERFSDVNIDGCSTELIWHRLTESERAEFEKLVTSNQMHRLVELWAPWWCVSSEPLVEEIGKESATTNAIPPLLADIRNIEQLAKCGTSDLISFSIINVLYAYAYTARLYNGEHLMVASESAVVILDISESLGRGVFTDVALAVGGCLSRLDCSTAQAHFISRQYSISVVDDVCKIVAGASRNPVPFPLAALSDCHRIFRAARKEVNRDRKKSGTGGECADKDKVCYHAVEKKLEFFVSWTSSHGHKLLDLLPALELESCELTTQLAVHQSERARVEQIIEQKKSVIKQQRPLIEEISSS